MAIDGPDAAGKTTLADAVADALPLPVVRASIDGFHNPRETRLRRGTLSAEGYYQDSFDYESLTTRLLRPFAHGAGTVATRAYDFRGEVADEVEEIAVPTIAVLVIDGVFLLRPDLVAYWDRTVYLHVSPAESLRRAKIRDLGLFGSPEAVEQRYQTRYLPGQLLYRNEARPREVADVLVDNTDPTNPIILRATVLGGSCGSRWPGQALIAEMLGSEVDEENPKRL